MHSLALPPLPCASGVHAPVCCTAALAHPPAPVPPPAPTSRAMRMFAAVGDFRCRRIPPAKRLAPCSRMWVSRLCGVSCISCAAHSLTSLGVRHPSSPARGTGRCRPAALGRMPLRPPPRIGRSRRGRRSPFPLRWCRRIGGCGRGWRLGCTRRSGGCRSPVRSRAGFRLSLPPPPNARGRGEAQHPYP